MERALATGVSERQIAAAQSYHREVEGRQPVSRTLVELGLATDEAVARWIAEFHGWSYLAREELRVEGDAHMALPEAIARNRHALVIARKGPGLVVAIADPSCLSSPRYAMPWETRPSNGCITPGGHRCAGGRYLLRQPGHTRKRA